MAASIPFRDELPVHPHVLGAATRGVVARIVAARATFIVSPWYDCLFFIFSPLLALALGVLVYLTRLSSVSVEVFDHYGSPTSIFIGSFTMAHLFIVFFRSNANERIYRLYPLRFTVVPMALFVLICASRWLAIAMSVLATWWDVYHSSLQTFGLGRIYDARVGNQGNVGRRLDYLLNLLLYAGPVLAGASLMMHTKDFRDFAQVDSLFFATLGDRIDANQPMLRAVILALGVPFLVIYIAMYWHYHRHGYNVSLQKVALLLSTGACSIYAWGFNTFGEAFFIMNFFHALQYFALVWWSEKRSMMSLFRLDGFSWGKSLTLALFLVIAFGYGFWATVFEAEGVGTRGVDLAFSAITVVAIMHFWYDGFIWSVRRGQV